ncbi:MAG: aspartate aminotransferase family protein, partial [Thermoprotei archaeon]|nr:aspartate aminotransferase family protein [Thermoprotei archaeon]
MKLLQLYPKYGLRIVRGYMQYVWDDKGNRYLDLHTGYGTAFLGHSNSKIVEKVYEQMRKIMVASYSFDIDSRDESIKALSKILPKKLEYVFFQNSGTEAVEAALKFSRKYTGRKKFVAFTNSFHGRTMGSLSLTWNPKYRKPFEPLLKDVVFLRFNDVFGVERFVDEETAAIIVEVVQGEGGLSVANKEFLKTIKEKCEEVGCVTIFDEVQTGFGRTGKIWAHQHYNVEPDIMTAGKAIAGGFPISIVATKDWLVSKLETGEHGTTHGGNPLACAALIGGIKAFLKENIADIVNRNSRVLRDKLEKIAKDHKLVRSVKGLGYMIGLELRVPPVNVLKTLQENKVLALKAGLTVLRLLPPYMITYEDMEKLETVIDYAIEK